MQESTSDNGSTEPVPVLEDQDKHCRIVLPWHADPDLYTRLREATLSLSVVLGEATDTDIRVVDARTDAPLSIDGSRPTLLVVDSADLPDGLEKTLIDSGTDQVECITDAELGGPILSLRINLLKSRIAQAATENIVRDNAYTILQTIMRVSNDWMVVKGLDNTFLLASKYVCRSFELSEEQIIGKNDLEVGTADELVLGKPGTDWIGYWALDKRLTDSGESAVIEPIIIANDERQLVRESTTKISLKDHHGRVFGLLVLVSAVNTLKANTGESRSSLTSIWEETSVLNKSPALLEMQKEKHVLELAKQATENAYIQKNQFVATASHDIRQPLHALGLFIHALQQRLSNPEEISILDKIKCCHGSITELLNSLLDVSKLDANVVSAQLTHFNISKLLSKLYDEQIEKANNKEIIFQIHSDESIVHCDEILLERILRNLITNAINHTTEGSVTVHAQRYGAQIRVQVSDTGPGIPDNQKDAIFLDYYRVDGDSTQGFGFGLGLAIVQRLCKLLSINLQLESTVGIGTQFKFLVPLGEAGKQTIEHQLTSPKVRTMPSILVVDDDHRVLNAMQAVLEQHGCLVITAECEQQLIAKIQTQNIQPSLLLIDYRLNHMVTGVQAIKSIHATLDQHFPAIVITGDTSPEGLREINESGHMVLHKPVLVETLLSVVNQALSIDLAGA